jgi:hypothetical protein
MTLVLSVATPAYGLHVSDRLLSKDGSPYDPLANKTVVFRATDGLLVFGYTGAAYINGKPTDTWIAETISGTSLSDSGTIRMGRFPVHNTGWSLHLLCEGLRNRNFERLGGSVCGVGWQWSAKRKYSPFRDVLWILHGGSGRLRWQQIMPRHLPERIRTVKLQATGDWPLGHDEGQQLLDRIYAAGRDWELAEGLLVEAIRRASVLRPGTIGSHCMSVLLRPWEMPNALVRFIPQIAHRAKAGEEIVEVAYTPWMIAPDAIHAPALSIGGLTCAQGLLTYAMEGPPVPDDQTLKGAFTTQPRPRP